MTAVRGAFQEYDRTSLIDKTLNPELAEFYSKREATLLRLEELSERLISRNEEYRQRLDEKLDEEKQRLLKDFSEKETVLDTAHAAKSADLDGKERALKKREEELNDRSSTHERRKIRQDFKQQLKDRSSQFSLTRDTQRKRWPVHMLFGMLMIGAGIGVGGFGLPIVSGTSSDWMATMRFALSVAAFAAAVAWYIRWQDRWSQVHADEEFRLRRLDLDIDRASWLVEMMLEWKEDKGTEIPRELIGGLSRGLFQEDSKTGPVRHPSEELLATLFAASAGIRVNVPGVGEVMLDRKSLRDFKSAVPKQASRESKVDSQ